MSFKNILKEKLQNKLSKQELDLLPKGYQKIGSIIIINLKSELNKHKTLIGETILELFPTTKTICNKEGGIIGEFREPQIEIIAGEDNTEVCHFENGVYFCFDIKKIMFAKGNVKERGRLPKQVKMNEIIVDMFSGIGYFSVPIAKIAKPTKIYAIDLNPNSIKYLKKTIEKNKLKNIEVIHGNSKQEVSKLIEQGVKADRVLMGYLPPPLEFISYAIKIIKKGGMIHYDDLISVDEKDKQISKTIEKFNKEAEKYKMKAKLINTQRVKSYSPKIDHYVLDVKIE